MSEIEKGKIKATKRLKKLDFSGADAAVALVSRDQGGGANGVPTLMIKAANFSDEFIEKMQTIRVELEIPDFLEKFFALEEEDAKALAYLMGYREDMAEEAAEPEMDFNDWVMSNMQSFEIMKALQETNEISQVLSDLTEEQYLGLLQDQAKFEKGLKKFEQKKQEELAKAEAERKKPRVKKSTASKTAEVKPQIVDEVNKGGVITPVVKQNKEQSMTQSTTVEQTVEVEMVAKAELDVIQKAFKEQQEQLEKALASVAKFEQERKEQIAKSRKDQLQAACGEHAEVLFKAVGEVEEGVFADVVKALSAMKEQVEKSKLFEEVGANVEPEEPADNATAAVKKALLAKLNQQTK